MSTAVVMDVPLCLSRYFEDELAVAVVLGVRMALSCFAVKVEMARRFSGWSTPNRTLKLKCSTEHLSRWNLHRYRCFPSTLYLECKKIPSRTLYMMSCYRSTYLNTSWAPDHCSEQFRRQIITPPFASTKPMQRTACASSRQSLTHNMKFAGRICFRGSRGDQRPEVNPSPRSGPCGVHRCRCTIL